jgi:membrane fusion protein (multidrug efflux system)
MRPEFLFAGISIARAGFIAAVIFGAISLGPGALAQVPPPVVGVIAVPVQDVSASSEFVGRVEALNAVDIRARVEGFIQERPFKEGQSVREGQVLFVIEKTAYEAALASSQAGLASAQATLLDAERRLQRNQELSRTQTVAQVTLDESLTARDVAKANANSAEAAVRQAELNLEYTTIKSPLSGRIGRAAFSVGSLVGPSSEALARVVQEDPIRVVFSVSDRTILQLRAEAGDVSKEELSGRFVPTLRFPTEETYPFSGTIEFLGNEFDPLTGTIPVWARFPNPRSMLAPGQFVTVVIRPAESQRRPLVPIGAVEQDREGRFVLVLDAGDKVAVRRIRAGTQIGQYRVIEEGLNGGEKLIVQGLQNARPGTVVQAIPVEDDALAATGAPAAQPPGQPAGSSPR